MLPAREPDTTPADRAVLPAVLLVVAAGALVTIAADGMQLVARPLGLSGGAKLALRLLGVALAVGGYLALRGQRRRITGGAPTRPDTAWVGVRTAATIMSVVTLLALLNAPPLQPREGGSGGWGLPGFGSPFGDGPRGGPQLQATTRGGESNVRSTPGGPDGEEVTATVDRDPGLGLFGRAAGLLPTLLLIAAIMIILRRLTRRVARADEEWLALDPMPPVLPEEAEAGLQASLTEFTDFGSDPRGQITNAYHRLLRALAEAGAPREPQEAPHEHLDRALRPLGVQPEPLHRLAALYVLAQFGGRPVTEEHRAAAVLALETSLAEVRATLAPSGEPSPAGAAA